MKQHSHLPVNIQLYNGKYPGSKCKLTSYKPSTYGISELLSDQPDYLSALVNWSNLVEEESGPMEIAEDISVPGEGFQKMPFWTTLSAGSSHHLRFYARTSTSLSFPDLSASLHSSAPYFNFEASGVKPTSADMRMIVNMGGSAFHSTTSSIMRNPVSMLVHSNELSGKPPAGKGDGTGDGSGKSKRHRLRDPSDCVQRQTRIRIEVSDHQCAAQMSITDTSQSDVQGAESGNRRKQRTSPKVSEAVHSGIWWSNSDYFGSSPR